MPHGDTKFQPHWLSTSDQHGHRLSEWCEANPTDVHRAVCTLCNKQFSISNSGKLQILKHADGKIHKDLQKTLFGQKQLVCVKDEPAYATGQLSKSNRSNVAVSSTGAPVQRQIFRCETIQEQVEKAEILWSKKMCVEDWSFASCDGISDLFGKMFPGPVSIRFSMGRSKASYMVSDGLGPYFKKG